MKNLLFLIIFTNIILINIHAQFEKGKILFDIKANYSKTYYGNNNYYSEAGGYIKNLKLSPDIAFVISNKWILNIGLNYTWQHNPNANQQYVINQYITYEQSNTHNNIFIPYVGMSYYKALLNKLYFKFNSHLGYGIIKSKTDITYAQINQPNTTDLNNIIYQPGSYLISKNIENNTNLINVGIHPEFMYFITNKIALNLQLGGAELLYYSKNDNPTEWNVSFAPSNWDLGFSIVF